MGPPIVKIKDFALASKKRGRGYLAAGPDDAHDVQVHLKYLLV